MGCFYTRTLLNEDLYSENIADYSNHEIVCCNNPDSVGIYTAYGSYGLKYVVYLNDFNGNISLQRDFKDFEIAVIRARQWYETLIAYYNLVEKDCVNTL